MKRIFILIISLISLLVFSLAGCAPSRPADDPASFEPVETFRDIPGIKQEEIAAIEALIEQRKSFKYGVLVSSEAFRLSDGSNAGFTINLCKLLSNLFEIDFIPKYYEWDNLMEGFEAFDVDFTGELTPTEEREKKYTMTIPIAERLLRVFMLKDSDKIRQESDIDHMRIGFLEDVVIADNIRKAYTVPFYDIYVPDYATAAQMILDGELDAFIDEAVADPAFEEYAFISSKIIFPRVYSPVSLSTANPELSPIIRAVNKYLTAGGIDLLYELYKDGDSEYAKYKLFQSFTEAEKNFIYDLTRRGASVSVGFEHDNYPITFYDYNEGEFQGISVDVLAEISKLTNLHFEPAVSGNATWAEILKMVENGEIQMVDQLLYLESRTENCIWSAAPYAKGDYVLLSRSDFANLAAFQVVRARVGAVKGSAKIDLYNDLFPNNRNLLLYDTQNQCLDALERGDVDLIIASDYTMLAQANYREKTGFKINISLNIPLDSHFGFNKDEAVLCSIVDKAQAYVNTESIELSWTGRVYDYSKKMTEQRARFLFIFGAVTFIILLVTIFLFVKSLRLSGRLKDMANIDGLTGIYNRRYFIELCTIQSQRAMRTGTNCFIILFDLDRFKNTNDTYGHQAGDQVLKETARRVKSVIRPYDIFARYGGEEFTIFMTATDEITKENIVSAVERCRIAICETPVIYNNLQIPVSASFGISYAAPRYEMEIAATQADIALYQAKNEGRNRVVFYNDDDSDNQ